MKLYEGNAPCPGCGMTGKQKARPSKESLCHDCQNQLEIGRAICKERALDRNFYRMDDLRLGDMTWYTIPIREVDNALKDLLMKFSEFDRQHVDYKGTPTESQLAGKIDATTSRNTYVLPDVTFAAAQRLCESIKEVCRQLKKDRENYQKELDKQLAEQKNDIYNEGVAHGRDLLRQLNNGEITPNMMLQRITRYESK